MKFLANQWLLPEDISPELREFLSQYEQALQASIQPYVQIKFAPQPELTPWQSKLGGTPYLPLEELYPLDEDGQPLEFLAQLNFTEVPALPNFPTQGILQFYISGNHDLYGANFEQLSDRDNFRLVYFPEIINRKQALVQDFSFLPEFENSPFSGSAALRFTPKFAPVSVGDYRFEEYLGFKVLDLGDQLGQEYYETFGYGQGHRIGGYPGFTQEDPRSWQKSYRNYDCLLLQFDSDEVTAETGESVDLMWGDAGIANFFITSAALAKLDFSEVLFNWDCC